MATVKFETSSYRNSHGKEPRGHGHWAFEIGNFAYAALQDSGIKLPNIQIDSRPTNNPGLVLGIIHYKPRLQEGSNQLAGGVPA